MENPSVDTSEAVEIAHRVWWVGSIIPDDRFQCHAYLIEQGDQSVLIDPGSALITDEIIRKIESVTPLQNIRWLVCSHADPDIIGSLPKLVAHGLHPDAHIVTFWRDQALIVHCGTTLPFWRIEEHDWCLTLVDRTLRFTLTPYLHFAGAFITYDDVSRTLFSSDLFGGFTMDPELYASSMDYFNAIRAFHEHYMPSREILAHAIQAIRDLPLDRIAPQHGQIIPRHLIGPIMDKLETLECGIYLLARNDAGLRFLLNMNQVIKGVVDVLVTSDRFADVLAHLATTAATILQTKYLEVWATQGNLTLWFHEGNNFQGSPESPPDDVLPVMLGKESRSETRLILPIKSANSNVIVGAAVLGFASAPDIDRETMTVLTQIVSLVEVGLEKEMLTRFALEERATWRKRAIHDPLTGVLNRVSLDDNFERLMTHADSGEALQIAAMMIDIDHFKVVNDTFGHPIGDRVLQHVATSIVPGVRPTDLVFRYGGEEFLVLLIGVDRTTALAAAQRIHARVALPAHDLPPVTVSIGVAMLHEGEERDSLISRADAALYVAKISGRDQIRFDEDTETPKGHREVSV